MHHNSNKASCTQLFCQILYLFIVLHSSPLIQSFYFFFSETLSSKQTSVCWTSCPLPTQQGLTSRLVISTIYSQLYYSPRPNSLIHPSLSLNSVYLLFSFNSKSLSSLNPLSCPVLIGQQSISEDTGFATQELDNNFTHKLLAPLIAIQP